jgi:tetratricopeptide (TPR) repeat protein/DNA-binding CsgD family transcriptional regulator
MFDERLTAMFVLVAELREHDQEEALRVGNESLELARRLGDDHGVARALREIGEVYHHLGDNRRALEAFQGAMTSSVARGDRNEIASTSNLVGRAHRGLAQYAEAAASFELALGLFTELGDRLSAAKMSGNRGMIHARLGEVAKALELLRNAREVYVELDDRVSIAVNSVNIGTLYKQLGDYETALEHFQLAYRMREEAGHSVGMAQALSNVGTVYRALGEHANALEYLRSALRLHRQASHGIGIANAIVNIGNVHADVGEHAEALERFRESGAMFEQQGDRNGVATVALDCGNVFLALGSHRQALEQFTTALALFSELGELNGIALATGRIASVHATKGSDEFRPEYARELVHRALDIAGQTGNRVLMQGSHAQLAELYREAGEWREAYDHLARSHALKEELDTAESRRKVEQFEHLKAVAEMEKRRALERAEEQSQREALVLHARILEVGLEAQRAELAAQAMHLARQTEMLGTFRNDLRAIVRETGDPLAAIRRIREKLKELPCEAIDWAKFDAEFRQTYPDFQSKLLLRHPDLTGMEIKVCALLRLKLTSADIAKLLCLSERSVEGHRLRIRRKMRLDSSSDVHTALAAI